MLPEGSSGFITYIIVRYHLIKINFVACLFKTVICDLVMSKNVKTITIEIHGVHRVDFICNFAYLRENGDGMKIKNR